MKSPAFLIACTLALAVAAPAAAQQFPVKMTGQHSGLVKGRDKFAIPSYSINYIIGQRASASGGIMAKASATTILAGVDEAMMRTLANEAHADLKAQMAAAGLTVSDDAEARGVLASAGVEMTPGNMHQGGDGGIVIGKGVKKKFVSVGADAAPLTELFPAGGKTTGIAGIARIGATGKLNGPGAAIGAVLIFPSLTIDFAESEAKVGRTLTGDKRATASNEVRFAIRAESPVNFQNPVRAGIGTPGVVRPAKDYATDAPFATVEGAGGATSRERWNSLFDDGMLRASNQVTVDPAKWTALVQDAYRSYNAALVAAIVGLRK